MESARRSLSFSGPRLTSEDCQELDVDGFKARFKVTSKLGSGGFADVLLLKDACAPDQQQQLALKVLRSTTACTDVECIASGTCTHAPTQAPEVVLFREARALKHARHPNVVQMYSVLHVPKACVTDSSVSRSSKRNPHGGSCWGLLIEYLQGGSLQQLIYNAMCQPRSSTYSQADALQWAVDIASAVAHLHSLNPVVLHRDLKLENILLRKPTSLEAAAQGGRKLPIAKLTDFGLHVMIDRPPTPFLITTGEDGMPLLILSNDDEQQQAPAPAQAQQYDLDKLDQLTASNVSSDPSSADALARVAPAAAVAAGSSSSSTNQAKPVPLRSAMHQPWSDSKPPAKHVAFAAQQAAEAFAADAADAADAAADSDAVPPAAAGRYAAQQQAQLERLSPSSPSQPQQWTRLTARTLQRLSLDNSRAPKAASSSAVSVPARIPLLLQSGYGSFVSAAVPSDAFTSSEPLPPRIAVPGSNSSSSDGAGGHEQLMQMKAADGDGGGSSSHGDTESISSILAAANTHKDYEVNLKAAVIAAQKQQHLQRNSGSKSGARSCASEAGAGAASAAGGPARSVDGSQTPRGTSQGAPSVKSGDWPTAASMVWDDLMDEDVDQEMVLDAAVPPVGSGHSGAPVPLPLSYDLTGQTGSFLYMSPEVYQRKPYAEKVDIFSLGVMLYELFSRSLVIYTHTPANCAEDCERYAGKVAQGYRPKKPIALPQDIWDLIEACWAQDPSDRPPASEVLAKLQLLLQQAQAEQAAKGATGLGRLFARRSAPAAPTTAARTSAATPAGADQAAALVKADGLRGASAPVLVTAGGSLGSGDVKAEVIAASALHAPAAQHKASTSRSTSLGMSKSQPQQRAARPEPACGCVIC